MKKLKKRLYKILVAFMIFLLANFLPIETMIEASPDMHDTIRLCIYLVAYFIAGGDVVKEAAQNILNGQVFDENFLMTIATIGAFLVSEYPEAVAVMLFYQVGELFQSYAVTKSRKSIAELMDIRPDYANIKADDGRNIPILTMGPICITPKLKRQGYGKILLDYSIEKATELGFGAVCFEGNINFYGKSGFTFASEFGLRYHGLPEDADASFFLCKELIPGYLNGITGEYGPPEVYLFPEEEAEEFDKK